MVGLFSFLFVASLVALVVAAVLLMIRAKKKQPKKPVAILAAVSVAVALVSFVVVGVTYQPTPEQIAERERIAAEKEERERLEAEEAARAAEEAAQAEAEEAARREAEEAARAESVAPSESQTPEPSTSVPASAPSEPPAKPEASTKPSTNDAPSTPPDSEEDGTGSDGEDFITAHKSDIIVASKMTLDNYVSGYKIPLAPQLWTVAAFDDAGAVAAMVDATNESTKETATVIVVLTPVMDGDRMTEATPHYIAVGDTVYGDDGYCDEVFSVLEEALDGQ